MTTNAQRIQFLVAQEDGFNRSRLPALYSDFRGLKTTNPEGYAANIGAWRRGLASLVRSGMLPAAASASSSSSKIMTSSASTNFLALTTGSTLLDALQSDRYGRPLALDAVISEAVQARDLLPLEKFLHAKESIYNYRSWSAWAVGLPWNALSWGLHQLGVVEEREPEQAGNSPVFSIPQIFDSRTASNQVVVLANVEAAAAAFAAKTADAQSPFERVWSVAHFKRFFSRPGAIIGVEESTHSPESAAMQQPRLSDMDLNILLVFLARDKNLISYDGHIVKLRGAGDTGMITEEDRAVAQLRELIDSLTHQTSMLSRRIDDLNTAAREAVLRKNRVAALAALKSKKQAEAALTTRFTTLAQLEATATKIEQAAGQVHILQAMGASADALKSLHAQVGGVEGVEGVVDRLRDQMDAADEINRILVEGGPTAAALAVDEGEIDDELAALEIEEQRNAGSAGAQEGQESAAEETRKRLEAAGTVPDHMNKDKVLQDVQQALEEETVKSMHNLSLNSKDQPPTELAG
ncbi:hypothetical protein SEPCBS57363_006088 [Sporothrix epigloea]|uniref:Snf7 family protein n=1 Tax=Sporothrix epigloea TaxID=1892477 RepID=A0ABP0E315_9PEZI